MVPPTRKIRRVSGGPRPDGDGVLANEAANEEEAPEVPEISGLVAPEVVSRFHAVERRIEDLLRRFKQVTDDSARAIGKGIQLADELETLKSGTLENMQVAFDENAEILEAIEKEVTELKGRLGGVDPQVTEQLEQLRGAVEERVSSLETTRAALIEDVDLLKADLEITRTSVLEAKGGFDERMPEIDKKVSEGLALVDERIASMRAELERVIEEARVKADALAADQKRQADEMAAEHKRQADELAAEQRRQSEDMEARLAALQGDVAGDLKGEVKRLGERLDSELASSRDAARKIDETLDAANGASERSAAAVKQIEAAEEKLRPLLEKFEESVRVAQGSRERIDLAMRLVDDVESKIRRLIAPVDDAIEQVESFEAVVTEGELGFELHDLLQVMIKHNASDLHLKVGSPPTVRLDGELIPVGNDVLTENDCKRLVFGAITRAQRRQLMQQKELDFAYSIPEARFRINAFLSKGTVNAAFRLLRTEMPSIDEMHLPQVLKQLATQHSGLVLVTGPAGSGKSTTLAAMIDHVNTTLKRHVITIEDPIEFVHKDKQSIITQREIGTDTPSFQDALRQALRQDPNVILIGEMRDPETILTAAVAAETGHLVLSTLHTQNSVQAVDRMLDVFTGEQQRQFRLLLANTLRGVVSQRLLQRADQQGRVAAVEVLVATPTIQSLILEGKTNEIYPYLQQGTTEGMQTFTASLTRLFEQGLITKDEALHHADQPTEFRLEVEGHTSGSAQYSAEGGDTLMNWL